MLTGSLGAIREGEGDLSDLLPVAAASGGGWFGSGAPVFMAALQLRLLVALLLLVCFRPRPAAPAAVPAPKCAVGLLVLLALVAVVVVVVLGMLWSSP